jgi:hypothetical protein
MLVGNVHNFVGAVQFITVFLISGPVFIAGLFFTLADLKCFYLPFKC